MGRLSAWLLSQQRRGSPICFTAYSLLAAVLSYSTVYAYRKPFTASTYEGK